MKRYGMIMAMLILAVTAGCSSPGGQDSAEIRALSNTWLESLNGGDLDTLVGLYAEDTRLMAPNSPTTQGHDAVRAVFGGMIEAGLSSSFEQIETVAVADVGYNVGAYTLNAADGTTVDQGKFMEVWRKVDGAWKIAFDTFNSDLPPPPGGELVVFTHKVEDLDHWLAAWQGEGSRHEMFAANGAASVRVMKGFGESDVVGLVVEVADMEAIHNLLNSEEGATAMKEDGVIREGMQALVEAQ